MKRPGSVFRETGTYHARGVFSLEEVTVLESEFDRIVRQLSESGEAIDARGAGVDAIWQMWHSYSDN